MLRPSAITRAWTTPITRTTLTKGARTLQPSLLQRCVASASSSPSETSSTDEIIISGEASTITQRLPRHNLSMDLRTVANELDTIKSHLTSRSSSTETVAAAERIAAASQDRVNLIQTRNAALQDRKEQSALIGQMMRNQDTAQEEALATAKELSHQATERAAAAEEELSVLESEMNLLLNSLPNLLDDRVPEGKDESNNEIVHVWGDPDTMPSGVQRPKNPQWHDDIAADHNGYPLEAATQMSGARFVALKGSMAQLERALAMWMVDVHTQQNGYTEVAVPYIVGRSALLGTSQLPKFEDDLFAITPESHKCNGEDAFLIPTAEVPVTNLHANQVLDEDDLPLSYVAWTPCFRAEAGSYGRDTKGLIRTHQFNKVELVKITTAETSDAEHEALTGHAEACLRALELPYRKVRLCAGDIGFAAQHCYDLEVWLPGAMEYREISSCSNTGDFQARRMALRYRPTLTVEEKKKKKKSKPVLCHTINGSGLAVGRALVAVLENYQQEDGSVVVPKVLRPYMGGRELIEPPSSK